MTSAWGSGIGVASTRDPIVCRFTPLSVRIVPSTRWSSTTALLRSVCACSSRPRASASST